MPSESISPGDHFGHLTVLSYSQRDKGGARWNCSCACGTTCTAAQDQLVRGSKISCGCANKKQPTARLIGERFGSLVVIALLATAPRWFNEYAECACDCGRTRTTKIQNLTHGRVTACRYCQPNYFKHGHSRRGEVTDTYNIWCSMLERCHKPRSQSFDKYGAVGIKVCRRWRGKRGFEHFLEDMGERPSKKHSIDRYPDQRGGYSPSNCRWATWREQQQNRKSNVLLTAYGRLQCASEWARELDVPLSSMLQWIKKKPSRTVEQYAEFRNLKRAA